MQIMVNGVSREMTAEEVAEVAATPHVSSQRRMRRIAPLAFRRRFGAAIGPITLAASSDMEAGDATLQVMLDDVSAAGYANLDDAPLQAGVQLLVTRGLLTAEQAVAQLADGQPGEEPA